MLAILEGTAKLWETPNSVVITQVVQYPQRRVMQFWLAAGDLTELLELAPTMYEWGKQQGCSHAVFTGRRGWTKPLAAQGWEPSPLVQFTKEL